MNDTSPVPTSWWSRLREAPRLRAATRVARTLLPYGIGALVAFAALALYNVAFPPPPPITTRDVNEAIAAAMASATPPPSYSSQVYAVIRPSLVLIQTDGSSQAAESHSLGSGVVVDAAGDILTSLHVVDGASAIQVTFADGTTSSATIAASQPENDIAVLQAATLPQVLVPAVLGNPGAMSVGDDAYVVGNPFGLYGSMSSGVISGFDRVFERENGAPIEGMIQIDAAVNPGNSGGPLLNRAGQVVGIVTGIINPTEQEVFIGIGFAVPINVAGGAAGMPPY